MSIHLEKIESFTFQCFDFNHIKVCERHFNFPCTQLHKFLLLFNKTNLNECSSKLFTLKRILSQHANIKVKIDILESHYIFHILVSAEIIKEKCKSLLFLNLADMHIHGYCESTVSYYTFFYAILQLHILKALRSNETRPNCCFRTIFLKLLKLKCKLVGIKK